MELEYFPRKLVFSLFLLSTLCGISSAIAVRGNYEDRPHLHRRSPGYKETMDSMSNVMKNKMLADYHYDKVDEIYAIFHNDHGSKLDKTGLFSACGGFLRAETSHDHKLMPKSGPLTTKDLAVLQTDCGDFVRHFNEYVKIPS